MQDLARDPREESLDMALHASGTTAQTKSFELVRVRVHPHWEDEFRVSLSSSSAGLAEVELGLAYDLSAQIELELELCFQLRPWHCNDFGVMLESARRPPRTRGLLVCPIRP